MARRKRAIRKGTTDPEDEKRQAELAALLKHFDAEVERRIYEMRRKSEQLISSIDGQFKLALLRMPTDVKNQLLVNAIPQKAESPEPTAPADILASTASRTTRTGKRGRARGRTPAARAAAPPSAFVTPLHPPLPQHCSTPAITPKFDPRTVQLTAPASIRRQRSRELLVSLRGSPVAGLDTVPMLAAMDQQLQREPLDLDQVEEETKELIARLQAKLGTYLG